jgi:DcmR-like sensory protein
MGKTRDRKSPKSTHGLNQAVTITHGDHLVGLYATENERLMLAVPFLLDGLREGSLCFLIGADSSTKQILTQLKMGRPEIGAEIAEGRLIAAEHRDTPRDQYGFFESVMSGAEQAGVNSFRLFADMIGAREHMSIEQILDLEQGFDEAIVHKHQMAALCAYDVRGFSGIELLAALRAHRGAVRYASDDTLVKAKR